MMVFSRGRSLAIGVLALGFASAAGAQESLDSGKTPAQLFASDCAICHKSPQGLTKSSGILGLDSFLREHYTASRESAAAIARYLQSMDRGPAAPGRAAKKDASKGDDKSKGSEKKSSSGKAGAKSDAKPGDATSSEPKPAEANPVEAKPAEAKPAETKPSEPKPAETPKSDGPKSD